MHKGFTLIEILIAVSIIALLILVPILAFGQIQKQSRDAKRKSDVSQIQQALSQYQAENGDYPQNLDDLVTEGYLAEIPIDPLQGQAVQDTQGDIYDYAYSLSDDGTNYSIVAPLEEDGEEGAPNKYIVANPIGLISVNGTPTPTPEGGINSPPYLPTNTPVVTPTDDPSPGFDVDSALYYSAAVDPMTRHIIQTDYTFSSATVFSEASGYSEILPDKNPVRCFDGGATPRIVYYSFETGNGDIYVANYDGTNKVNLTNSSAVEQNPLFSPDGSTIAYMSNESGDFDLYTMDSDGTNVVRLTTTSVYERPVHFINNTVLVYTESSTGVKQIYRQNIDGTGRTRISPMESDSAYGLNVSYDGTKIVYSSTVEGSPDPYKHVFVMNPDGSNHTQLTTGSIYADFPVISPDNTTVLYTVSGDNNDFFTVPITGGSMTQLTNKPSDNYHFDESYWYTPNGQWIFSNRHQPDADIVIARIDPSSGAIVEMTDPAEGTTSGFCFGLNP
ncbi:MAG: DUF5050 domain-containing protein [Patescibacteria group bacterium]